MRLPLWGFIVPVVSGSIRVSSRLNATIWDINLTKTVAEGIRMFSFCSEVKRILIEGWETQQGPLQSPLGPQARPGLRECQRLGCHFPPCCRVAMTTDIEITVETWAGRETDLVTRWHRCVRFLCGLWERWSGWVNKNCFSDAGE